MNRPRDMALVEKIECTRDGAIMFACTSVETPRVPRIQGRVRAQIKVKLLFYSMHRVEFYTEMIFITSCKVGCLNLFVVRLLLHE